MSRNNCKIEVMSAVPLPGEGDPMSLDDMDKRRAHTKNSFLFIYSTNITKLRAAVQGGGKSKTESVS